MLNLKSIPLERSLWTRSPDYSRESSVEREDEKSSKEAEEDSDSESDDSVV